MDWHIGILQEIQQSTFSFVSYTDVLGCIHLNSCFTIEQDAFLYLLKSFFAQVAIEESV